MVQELLQGSVKIKCIIYKKKEDKTMLPIIRRSSLSVPSLFEELMGRDLMQRLLDDEAMPTMPAVNVVETNESFQIEVAAPGFEKKDFMVNLENNILTISTEKQEKIEKEQDGKLLRKEFHYAGFSRSFTLPAITANEKISASYKDGLLLISVPKKEEAKLKPPRQIDIS